jgi:hypothetical protein
MPDIVTPGITSDDAAILSLNDAAVFSLNSPDNGDDQQEDPFHDGRDKIAPNAHGKGRVKSGVFVPKEPLFTTTPGAKKVQW